MLFMFCSFPLTHSGELIACSLKFPWDLKLQHLLLDYGRQSGRLREAVVFEKNQENKLKLN